MTIYVPFGGRVYGNHTDSSDYDYYVLVENFSGYKDEKLMEMIITSLVLIIFRKI